jgi:ATP-dependent Clp protease ATP-binding subunit ClpA
VDQHPHSVVLLDEIEKAHPDIYNILLQVMDHGSLTDHNGKKIDFRNVILIMTTNAGASEMAKAAIGFGSSKRTGEDEEALNRLFTPEFRNRLDATIPFAPLPTEVIHQVVQKFVMQLESQLSERNVTFDLHQDAIAWLADKGYDERMGARPLSRVIQEHIKKPLANEILFGALRKGGVVKVTVGKNPDGKDGLVLESIAEAAPVKPKPEAEVESAEDEAVKPKAKVKAEKGKSKAADKPAKTKAETDVDVLTEEPMDKPRKSSTVPRVPKKK